MCMFHRNGGNHSVRSKKRIIRNCILLLVENLPKWFNCTLAVSNDLNGGLASHLARRRPFSQRVECPIPGIINKRRREETEVKGIGSNGDQTQAVHTGV